MTQEETHKFIIKAVRQAAKASGNGDPVFLNKFASKDPVELSNEQKEDLRKALVRNVSEVLAKVDDETVQGLSKSGFIILTKDMFNEILLKRATPPLKN